MEDKARESLPIRESESPVLMTALAVDDSESVRNAWNLVKLRHFNNRNVLIVVGSAEDAMAQIQAGELEFNVLFTDFNLGNGADGIELIKAAKKLKPGIVSVLVSSHSKEDIPPEDKGVPDFYLSKPFTLEEIDEKLQEVRGRIEVPGHIKQ